MAIGSEARSTFLAVVKGDASQAVSEFKKLGSSVEKSTSGAQGSVGKFKSFTDKAMGEFKANATMYAAGAGAALGAFALKSASEFAKLGVEVGKFSDATGLAATDASRWIEVAGDIGIEAGSLQTAIGKLNKSIDPKLFNELGIAISRTKDGATDVNGTFLNVIDRLNGIKDPAERAKVASKLLGKGWQEMSELIGQGSGKLTKSLAEVSDAKVIDAKEVEKARQYRAAMDKLGDAFQDIVLTVGQAVVPAISSATSALADLAPVVMQVAEAYGKFEDATAWIPALNPVGFYGKVKDNTDILGTLGASIKEGGIQSKQAAEAITYLGDTNKETAQSAYLHNVEEAALAETMRASRFRFEEATYAFKGFMDLLDREEAAIAMQSEMDTLIEKFGETGKIADDDRIKIEQMFASTIANGNLLASYNFKAAVDTGDLMRAQELINNIKLAAAAGATFSVKASMYVGASLRNLMEGRASGGPVSAGKPYMVGETGREMFIPSVDGQIMNSSKTQGMLTPSLAPANMGGGGGVVNVTVVAPVGANMAEAGRQVADALRAHYQSGGARVS